MDRDELVSVIMPSYNTGRYIKQAIESVLNQSYKEIELIIVDDCSSDNTDEIVAKIKDERITYIKNDENLGAALSRNRALREANGEWIAFLDSDDLWDEQKLEKQIGFMKRTGSFFSCTASRAIDEDSNELGKIYKSPLKVSRFGMQLYCWPGCLTVMYYKPLIGLVQIEDLKKNNDYAMWLKVIKKADCFFLDEVLASYRVRRNSISHDRFFRLVKAHYDLFRFGEKKTVTVSVINTGVNLLFGFIKKLLYEKR